MKPNADRSVQLADVLEALEDQSRIMLALHGNFANATDAARRLAELGIPPARIAALLNKPLNNVTSALAKARKRAVVGDVGASSTAVGEMSP